MTMTPTRPVTNGKKPPEPRQERMTITPALAEEYLGRNCHNRVLRNWHIEDLAGAIRRGEWMLNGVSICFATNGDLLDGQHRLWAVVESDMPIETWVTFDLPPESQDTMDQSIRRSLHDVLRLRRGPDGTSLETNPHGLAAAINVKWRWDEGLVRMISRKPSNAQAISVLERNPGLREAVASAGRLSRKFKMSSAILAVCWYEFSSLDPVAAEAFFTRLSEGIGLEAGSPILALRRWLERQMAGTAKSSSLMTHALLVKAWNYYRDGREIETLVWRATGMHSEPFPIPR